MDILKRILNERYGGWFPKIRIPIGEKELLDNEVDLFVKRSEEREKAIKRALEKGRAKMKKIQKESVMRMNETTLLSLLFIVFFSSGGFLVYKGIIFSRNINIIEAIVTIFCGLIFLFLGGCIVYALCINYKTNKKTAKK